MVTRNSSNTCLTVSSDQVTMPLQPAFLAYVTSELSNVTGDNTVYDVIFGTEVFDTNSDYNASTGILTSPVDGKYFISCSLLIRDLTSSSFNSVTIDINSSNNNYGRLVQENPYAIRDYSSTLCGGESQVIDMDAGDTAKITLRIGNATKICDVAESLNNSRFSGYLML